MTHDLATGPLNSSVILTFTNLTTKIETSNFEKDSNDFERSIYPEFHSRLNLLAKFACSESIHLKITKYDKIQIRHLP